MLVKGATRQITKRLSAILIPLTCNFGLGFRKISLLQYEQKDLSYQSDDCLQCNCIASYQIFIRKTKIPPPPIYHMFVLFVCISGLVSTLSVIVRLYDCPNAIGATLGNMAKRVFQSILFPKQKNNTTQQHSLLYLMGSLCYVVLPLEEDGFQARNCWTSRHAGLQPRWIRGRCWQKPKFGTLRTFPVITRTYVSSGLKKIVWYT